MALGSLLTSSFVLGGPTAAASVWTKPPVIDWRKCPEISDDELGSRLSEEELTRARQLIGRMECGTLSVPRSYDDPRGEQITVALTRLKATDQKRRLGTMVLNPGGPGGSGYLMPVELVAKGVGLDSRYDLIGFDPRGVGRSTKAACAGGGQGGRPQPGPVTEEQARKIYDETVERNKACAESNPELIGQLTTENVAHDVNGIRAALNERKISFFGVSWGSWLGAVLRSVHPGKVDRMWLDSVAPPYSRADVSMELRAKATDRDFQRMAAWIAERDDTYGLGRTRQQVVSEVEKMRKSYDAEPLTFTDIDLTVDGALISQAASSSSISWPEMAQVLRELRHAEGTSAPPTVKKVFGSPPSGAPGGTDRTANLAYHCNEDLGSRSFEAAWNAYQKRLKRYPVTGRTSPVAPMCAGWPLPVHKTHLKHHGGSLMLSGHRYETLSPWEGVLAMRAAIGGTLVTMDDDVHGSAIRVPGCAAKVIAYFETGRRATSCPSGPEPA
ncbi:alpha/beta fold hydrolase [Nonomuraea diastatica]|uniref:Alpha/beta fold hydrolase n=1 Tax=Nonomuraea diastatica TaxID=1848329 RepID=A0A4R4X6A4_9ACTN|nr:alpha/beta fold hydrolase [Nonomuraea diastatica]TDD25928.1 alpha/beta fold hydrolase [Nonomuraea diastatica]